MDFEDLLRKQEKTRESAGDQGRDRAPKRLRTDNETPFYETVATSLFEVWKKVRADVATSKTIDISKVEIEVRVGHIVADFRRWKSQCSRKQICCLTDSQRTDLGLTFRSGVDEIFVEHLKRVLVSDKFSVDQKPMQRLRCTDNGSRWEVDAAGGVVMVESKVKIFRSDLALLSHQYDVRVNAATEQPEAKQPVHFYEKWTMERSKRRKTFKSLGTEFSSWKIDLTEVDVKERSKSTSGSGSAPQGFGGREMELEFEMENAPMRAWLEGDVEAKAIQTTNELATQLFRLLNLCIPGETEPVGEVPFEVTNNPKNVQEILRINEVLKNSSLQNFNAGSSRGGGPDFLGCMPINLSRRNLLNVQRNNYYLAEKSDGMRYLLYVIETTGSGGQRELSAVLMNRAKVISSLHGAKIIGAALGLGTVLDGELVYNISLKETVYLVFDVLSVENRPCLQLPFKERTAIIRRDIMDRCARYLSKPALTPTGQPLKVTKLIRKNFVEKHQLQSDLLSKISLVDGERVYFDSDRRHHKSDGIIFQPDTPYTFSIDSDLLKWKWQEVRTVDLQILVVPNTGTQQGSKGSNIVRLLCGGPDGSLIDCSKRGRDHVGLGEFDTFRLMADIQDFPQANSSAGWSGNSGSNNRIAEVVYDASIGTWGYMHLRKDKTDPNYIDTVMGVFMEQAEGISSEELLYRMLMKQDSADDYNAHLQKMKMKLLDWQIKSQGK